MDKNISLLARQGKIDACKEGRLWCTTEKAVKDYIASRKRKRKLGYLWNVECGMWNVENKKNLIPDKRSIIIRRIRHNFTLAKPN
jgi:hypothetical protein